MTTTFAGEVGDLLQRVDAATALLRSSRDVPAEVVELIEHLDTDLYAATPLRLDIDPYLSTQLYAAALVAMKATRHDNASTARREVRVALERVRHCLRDIEDRGPVAPDVPTRQIVAALVEAVPVPHRELAQLLGVTPRQLQRWLAVGDAGPTGATDERVRAVAIIANQLRHTFTPLGIIAWFRRPHPHLGQAPLELLDDPLRYPELVSLALSARASAG